MIDLRSNISFPRRRRGFAAASPLVIYAAMVGVSLGIVTALSVLSLTV
jgi:hypothetical protein